MLLQTCRRVQTRGRGGAQNASAGQHASCDPPSVAAGRRQRQLWHSHTAPLVLACGRAGGPRRACIYACLHDEWSHPALDGRLPADAPPLGVVAARRVGRQELVDAAAVVLPTLALGLRGQFHPVQACETFMWKERHVGRRMGRRASDWANVWRAGPTPASRPATGGLARAAPAHSCFRWVATPHPRRWSLR